MIGDLSGYVSEAVIAGDLQAARVANDAISVLLGSGVLVAGGEVVELAGRRSKPE